MIDRNAIVEESRSWLLTPYRHNQCWKTCGVDCVRFLCAIADKFNIEHGKLPKHYDRLVKDDRLLEHLRTYFVEKPIVDAQNGDILVFKFYGVPHHLGIAVLENDILSVIHASLIHEKVVEHPIDERWRRVLVAVFSCIPMVYKSSCVQFGHTSTVSQWDTNQNYG